MESKFIKEMEEMIKDKIGFINQDVKNSGNLIKKIQDYTLEEMCKIGISKIVKSLETLKKYLKTTTNDYALGLNFLCAAGLLHLIEDEDDAINEYVIGAK